MRNVITGVVVWLSAAVNVQGQSNTGVPRDKPDILCWQEERKLVWSDFQAKTKPILGKDDLFPDMILEATTKAEVLVYDLLYNVASGSVQKKTVARVEFDKSKSWVDNTGNPDKEAILAHEQVHFDIEELTARRIRQILTQCEKEGKPTDAPEVKDAINCLFEEGADLQNLYDQETLAGSDPLEQIRWVELIADNLKRLVQYRSKPADCSLY